MKSPLAAILTVHGHVNQSRLRNNESFLTPQHSQEKENEREREERDARGYELFISRRCE